MDSSARRCRHTNYKPAVRSLRQECSLKILGTGREREIDKNDPVVQEFIGYWRLSEEMVTKASKEEIVETARILAMQVAHFTRKYGEQELPDFTNFLSASAVDNESVSLLRDGSEAFVGVLATVSGGSLDEPDMPVH